MQVPVVIDGQRFTFNFELDVDACRRVHGRLHQRLRAPRGGRRAVVEAFQGGVITTGQPPLALLLDNRPSNHTPEVDLALGDTLRIRATPARPQNKAHVEGAFGLFSRVLPDLVLDTRTGPLALAGAFVSIVVQLWARTTNHRPRADRGGRSRVDLYAEQPSDEQTCHRRVRRPRPRNRQPPASHLLARLARRRAPFARDPARRALFLAAAHRIEATFSITPRERHDAVRVLADCVAVNPVVGHLAPARALRAPGAQRSPCADVGYATEGVSQPVAI